MTAHAPRAYPDSIGIILIVLLSKPHGGSSDDHTPLDAHVDWSGQAVAKGQQQGLLQDPLVMPALLRGGRRQEQRLQHQRICSGVPHCWISSKPLTPSCSSGLLGRRANTNILSRHCQKTNDTRLGCCGSAASYIFIYFLHVLYIFLWFFWYRIDSW